MQILSFPYGIFQANMYVLLFQNEAIIIDPCTKWEKTALEGVSVKSILCTHGHFDHISRVDGLRQLFPCPLYISELDQSMLTSAELNCSASFGLNTVVSTKSEVLSKTVYQASDLGITNEDFSMTVVPTPGHTDGSVCFMFEFQNGESVLFTGDMLFSGGIGRTDLGGDEDKMRHSIELLKTMDDGLICYPGHGPMTVLGREKRTNPYFG